MALRPGVWFRVHAHPNIEFELTLAGCLSEIRLCGAPGGGLQGAVEEGEGLALSDSAGALRFEEGAVPAGKFLANTFGRIHQSFTKSDGALILVLWSGCHANIRPEHCSGLKGQGAALLQPGAGWA